eukprot:GHRR01001622.1.p4 GENE.GHRR01001622.1~~GHRR01001622.1.p4  ORF type:complete len:127 (+),score=36.99 GHRR01001622.1:2908-3288(+)
MHQLDSTRHQLSTQQQQRTPNAFSKDIMLKESEHCRGWLDAKACPVFVVTIRQHVEQLSDLADPGLVDLSRIAVALTAEIGCSSFNTMILNHGDNRNHAHLHLKIMIQDKKFNRAAAVGHNSTGLS